MATQDSPTGVTRVVPPADTTEAATRFAGPADASEDVTRFAPAGDARPVAEAPSPADALTVATPVTPTPHGVRGARRTNNAGPLEVGQSFGPRYHIIRLLGAGGMGAVYQAWDAELGVAVAIKVIRPEVMADPATAEEVGRRFKRELLLARQVTHKNVVRIHDIGDIDGIKYITMSYVEGTDLASILKKGGKRPVPELLPIARSVISGLVAAHAAGVVHRDLKPANIMISKEGEALIMDFGIAHSTGDAAAASRPVAGAVPEHLTRAASQYAATTVGSVIGTVEYMAPEQARGQPIDQRVDVYAFGLILYDALLGQRRATSGAAAVEELQRRMSAPPPPLQALVSDIPAPLAALVGRCVEPEAEKRFQTSADVAAELNRIDDHGKLIPIARRLTGRMLATAALLVATLVSAAVYVTRQATQPAVQHEPVSVVIADVENPTNNAAFAGTLEPMIRLALEETGFVTAFDRTQLRALGLPPVKGAFNEAAARAAALNQGRGVVVTASIGPDGRGFALALKAVEAVTGNVIATTEERFARAEEVLTALSRASTTVREALGDEISESARRFAMETLSATSLDAVAQYARAMNALSNGNQPDAKAAALKAIEIDQNFGSAYGVAAIAARNMGQMQEATGYIQQAANHLESMTQRERLRTRGFSAELRGNHQQCAEEYGELIARYQADASARNNRAVCLTQLRDMRQALGEIRQASSILPKRALYKVNTALFAAYGSDFAASERAAREALELNPAFPQGIIARAFAQLGQGRLADAAATYGDLQKVSPSDAASGFADLAMYEGRFADAVKILKAGIQADLEAESVDRAADKLVALGYAELMRGNRRAVVAAAEQALERSPSPKIRLLAGRLFSEAGDPDRAGAQARELGKALPVLSQVYGKIIEGNIALQRGANREAVQILTEANTKLLDTWIGRFDLGRAYLAAEAFAEADGQFDRCLTRPGEAMSLALDEVPTFAYFPQVYYYMGRARQGQGVASFAESYRAYLNIRGAANEDRLLEDVRRRMKQP
jgi:tetratricopeptide (TPR) repeat protein/tRNA A-37 threonylcarbamoyl transferase component Bud32